MVSGLNGEIGFKYYGSAIGEQSMTTTVFYLHLTMDSTWLTTSICFSLVKCPSLFPATPISQSRMSTTCNGYIPTTCCSIPFSSWSPSSILIIRSLQVSKELTPIVICCRRRKISAKPASHCFPWLLTRSRILIYYVKRFRGLSRAVFINIDRLIKLFVVSLSYTISILGHNEPL